MFFYQNLYGKDFANRVNFCKWMRRQFDLNFLFIYYLMFFNEVLLTDIGRVNRHNMHYWSDINSHWMKTVSTSIVLKFSMSSSKVI